MIMNICQKFIYLFLFVFMANLFSPNQTRGSEVLETNPYRNFWTTINRQEVETIVQDTLKTVNVQMRLPVSLELKECRLDQNLRVITLNIFKQEDKKNRIGYLTCRCGNKESINSYPNVDKMFPVVAEGKTTWTLLNYIEIYLGHREKGYGTHALKGFHCFVDNLDSDFTFLVCDTYVPYACHIYKKVGYEFHPTVLEAIKNWGQNKCIENGQEESEFLKNTSHKYGRNKDIGSLYMYRKKTPYPSDF